MDDQQGYIEIKSELSDVMHIYTLQWQKQQMQLKIIALGPLLKENMSTTTEQSSLMSTRRALCSVSALYSESIADWIG